MIRVVKARAQGIIRVVTSVGMTIRQGTVRVVIVALDVVLVATLFDILFLRRFMN